MTTPFDKIGLFRRITFDFHKICMKKVNDILTKFLFIQSKIKSLE